MTRARVRKMNEVLIQLLIDVYENDESKSPEPSTRLIHILTRQPNMISPDGRVLA